MKGLCSLMVDNPGLMATIEADLIGGGDDGQAVQSGV